MSGLTSILETANREVLSAPASQATSRAVSSQTMTEALEQLTPLPMSLDTPSTTAQWKDRGY